MKAIYTYVVLSPFPKLCNALWKVQARGHVRVALERTLCGTSASATNRSLLKLYTFNAEYAVYVYRLAVDHRAGSRFANR